MHIVLTVHTCNFLINGETTNDFKRISYEAIASFFCSFKHVRLNLRKKNKLYQTFFHSGTIFFYYDYLLLLLLLLLLFLSLLLLFYYYHYYYYFIIIITIFIIIIIFIIVNATSRIILLDKENSMSFNDNLALLIRAFYHIS